MKISINWKSLLGLVVVFIVIFEFYAKKISFQLCICSLLLFGIITMHNFFPPDKLEGIDKIKLFILSVLIGMLFLWLAIDINPNELLFGVGAFSYLLHRIIFGLGFVFFGLLGGIALYLELKRRKE